MYIKKKNVNFSLQRGMFNFLGSKRQATKICLEGQLLLKIYIGLVSPTRLAKLVKKYIFLSFWVKHDSCDVYLKYGLIQNFLSERHF